MVEEPQVVMGESSRDVGDAFLDRVLDWMEEVAFDMDSMKAENNEVREGYAKVKGELEDLKV